ncbi:MAG: Eco57I restriction-modification methylase domain-containing protein, partial [Ardenticatenales bacterium]|nr:Eco57I restriction-modification methylase domain-containing protein [Ardenticatenales bacterium]
MTQLSLVEPYHRNQQLFSDHYLNVILPRRAEWQMLASPARAAMARVAAIVAGFTPTSNEAQTEKDLVQPILQALGHTFEVQVALRTPDGTKRPDYLFYGAAEPLVANKNQVMTEQLAAASGVFAVGDAKYWERPLDVTLKGVGPDPFSNRNPSYQIAFYMQHAGVPWGILTNGRLWRLYHRDTAHKLDRFYEVDLPTLLASNDVDAFLYFYAFFHRSAFDDHPLGVARLLAASTDFARGVGDTLKGQVYEALRHLAQGFLDYVPNGLRADEPTLTLIYDNALIVLYRLLFILYAESRELLPVRANERYRRSYSLHAIKNEVEQAFRTGDHLLPDSATLWPRLSTLFGLIDKGSPPLNVSTFNGGLFAPERHTFLNEYAVGDAHLQQALDRLARVDGQFVDYQDLEIRHLGTIYEGLLEYHLESVGARERGSGGAVERGSVGAGEQRSVGAGERESVVLVNEKGERKATGSYYTPDFIVKYMIDETLGPVLREAVAGATDDRAKIEAVLAVNVLDPSMGSGHFLVEATESIARFLVDLGIDPSSSDALPPPLKSGEGVAEGRGRGPDLAHWKRRVVQNCIYGVDLNPLAVELAKLSLWLTTVAKARPLSFLDHHLRAGNSLVGARVAQLQQHRPSMAGKRSMAQRQAQREAGQLALFEDDAFRRHMSTAVDSMWLIEGSAGRTVQEVKEQERVYERLRQELTERYQRLADLVTAAAFGGLTVEPALWKPLAELAMGKALAAPPALAALLREADALALGHHFFHWELEFPEVFFDRQGSPKSDAGFDVVIGNPPYVRQERLAPLKPYFAEIFASYHGVADLYVYFLNQGLQLLRKDGLLAYITSGTFRKLAFGAPLRQYLTS